jgi:hypothetical protein
MLQNQNGPDRVLRPVEVMRTFSSSPGDRFRQSRVRLHSPLGYQSPVDFETKRN